VCQSSAGAVVQCADVACGREFHVTCGLYAKKKAFGSRFFFDVKLGRNAEGHEIVQHKGYCPRHAKKAREAAEKLEKEFLASLQAKALKSKS